MEADSNDELELAKYLLRQMSPGKGRLAFLYLLWLDVLRKVNALGASALANARRKKGRVKEIFGGLPFALLLVLLLLPSLACSLTQAQAVMVAASPANAPNIQTSPDGSQPIPPTYTSTLSTCIVSTGTPGGTLYLRAGPGMGYSVLHVLIEGQTLTILPGVSEKWIQVQAGKFAGWINSNYCEKGQ